MYYINDNTKLKPACNGTSKSRIFFSSVAGKSHFVQVFEVRTFQSFANSASLDISKFYFFISMCVYYSFKRQLSC